MQKVCVFVMACLIVVPAMANDGLLKKLGLGGMQVVSDAEASQVIGRGFVFSIGFVEVAIDFDDGESNGTDIDAFQDIWLEGLSSLTGETAADGILPVDFSGNNNGDIWIYSGSVTAHAETSASGSVDSAPVPPAGE